jgi:large subunit ribosomal protein L35
MLRALSLYRKGLFMRRPKGIKTKKSVSKRFKITASGKVVTQHAGKRHLLSGKNSSRRRRLSAAKVLHETDVYKIKASLPFSH